MNQPINYAYVILTSIFCVIIAASNLIYQKFLDINFFGQTFEVSAGLLMFPLTFVITDLITETYGKKAAKNTAKTSIICCLFVMLLVWISDSLPATSWSNLDDETFHRIFSTFGFVSCLSLFSNYVAQLVDIFIFAWMKDKYGNKHLWIRSNISTLAAQLIDSICIISTMGFANLLPLGKIPELITAMLLFKFIVTILSTPILYASYYGIKLINAYKT